MPLLLTVSTVSTVWFASFIIRLMTVLLSALDCEHLNLYNKINYITAPLNHKIIFISLQVLCLISVIRTIVVFFFSPVDFIYLLTDFNPLSVDIKVIFFWHFISSISFLSAFLDKKGGLLHIGIISPLKWKKLALSLYFKFDFLW